MKLSGSSGKTAALDPRDTGRRKGAGPTRRKKMNLSRTSRLAQIALALVCAAATAPAALAGGEPKNEAPFVRPAVLNASVHLIATRAAAGRSATFAARGEPKNGPPFIRVAHLGG
jgi:hypothetical protein